jgi:glycosyltransferase involved in cell wall biosynthesis
MIYLGYFFLFFGSLRLIVAFTNWITQLYLPQKPQLSPTSSISILVPARNEADNIQLLLKDLISFDYPKLEIIIYNDLSTDQTAAIVSQFANHHLSVQLINGTELPENWLGKNFACHQLAKQAKGDFLLFLDADVRVKNGLLERALNYTQKQQLSLLSIFPKQIMTKLGTKLTVPLMNWILLSLLPLVLVRRSSWQSFSAANGQFMLFEATKYKQLRPHEKFKSNKVEDIAIIRYYKQQKLSVATLLGDDGISCKMYDHFNDAVNGFSKNTIQFFGGSIPMMLLFTFITTTASLYIFYYNGLAIGLYYLINILLIRIFISIASKQSIIENVILMFLQQTTFIFIVIKSIVQTKNKTMVWKNRKIS